MRVVEAKDGMEGLERLRELYETYGDKLANEVKIIISDVEMPQMDGHHLLTQIREHNKLGKLPVIFFSSLINEEMRRKGEAIGANGQISKPEIGQLIDLIDSLVLKK